MRHYEFDEFCYAHNENDKTEKIEITPKQAFQEAVEKVRANKRMAMELTNKLNEIHKKALWKYLEIDYVY